MLGLSIGESIGPSVGISVGATVGKSVGATVGPSVGSAVCGTVGGLVGIGIAKTVSFADNSFNNIKERLAFNGNAYGTVGYGRSNIAYCRIFINMLAIQFGIHSERRNRRSPCKIATAVVADSARDVALAYYSIRGCNE